MKFTSNLLQKIRIFLNQKYKQIFFESIWHRIWILERNQFTKILIQFQNFRSNLSYRNYRVDSEFDTRFSERFVSNSDPTIQNIEKNKNLVTLSLMELYLIELINIAINWLCRKISQSTKKKVRCKKNRIEKLRIRDTERSGRCFFTFDGTNTKG